MRVGAIITDNHEFHLKSISEYTANLCANNIGQYIFGALAYESKSQIRKWYSKQNSYYKELFKKMNEGLKKRLPGIIISEPEASIYCILDFKKIADRTFDSDDFVNFCAEEGSVQINGKIYTVLLAPMKGFYADSIIGKTQVRLSFVEDPFLLSLTPEIISCLFKSYTKM